MRNYEGLGFCQRCEKKNLGEIKAIVLYWIELYFVDNKNNSDNWNSDKTYTVLL